jgi:membrane-associated phospholipid phosphatase
VNQNTAGQTTLDRKTPDREAGLEKTAADGGDRETAAVVSWPRRHAVKLLLLFFGLLLPLWLFADLAEDVVSRDVFGFDEPILLYMHVNASAGFDRLMLFFSFIGSALVLTPLDATIIGLCLYYGRKRDAMFFLLATGGAALLNFSAKLAFARDRPDLWPSISPEITYSFPSGHAMSSMAATSAMLVLLWHTDSRWRLPLTAVGAGFVFFVGLSRVYLGVHYPSDILAGWLASLAWVIGLALLIKVQWRTVRN